MPGNAIILLIKLSEESACVVAKNAVFSMKKDLKIEIQ